MSTNTTSPSQILEHTAAFISETLSQRDLRHRLFSTLRSKLRPSKSLNIAAETLEIAISTASPTIRSSSLRNAETIILSHQPQQNPFSSLLLSLIYGLSRRPLDSSHALLDLFQIDPSSARSEIAPVIFQELFLIHLLPVLQSLNQQRFQILSSVSQIGKDDEYSIRDDESVVISPAKSLSKMSDDQASELKDLERKYEEVVDENCQNLARYFKEVLDNGNGNLPPVMLKKTEISPMVDYTREQRIGAGEEVGFQNGRYNVMSFILF